MEKWIAFIRGINVGGKNILPMKSLTEIFLSKGFRNVETYIQSGNVVFTYDGNDQVPLSKKIQQEIKNKFSFEPDILFLTFVELEKAILQNPFPEVESTPESLHLGFLEMTPKNPDFAKLDSVKTATEEYRLIDKVFYLKAPDGVGRSKLYSRSENILKVPLTDRNWRTVCKMATMASDIDC